MNHLSDFFSNFRQRTSALYSWCRSRISIPAQVRFIAGLFLALIAIFVLQKVAFMFYNNSLAKGIPFCAFLDVLWHGLKLDITTTCYLMAIPVLLTWIGCFVSLPMRRILVPYYVLISIVFTLCFAVDTVLYSYWGAKPDANDLIYAAQPKEMLAGLPVGFTIGGFIAVGLIVWGCVMLLRWVTPRKLPKTMTLRSRLWTLLFLPLIGVMFIGIRGGLSKSTAKPSYAYFSNDYPFCNHAALNPTFNMFHSLFKVQDLAKEFDIMPESEVDALLGDIYKPDPTLADTQLRIERPNIMLVIWEGAGKELVGTSRVAPNLHRFMDEGLYFSNAYANNFRTDRGLVSVLSGWLGLPTATITERPDLFHGLPSLASSLRAAGYYTSMTYGGDINYTNLRMYFMETGFSKVNGGDAFPSELYSSAWGVPDEYVLTPALIPSNTPFFSAVLTLSSHEPWEVNYHRLDGIRENAFAYADSCLGVFIDQLKASPQWDSLLVIILPDHGCTIGITQKPADVEVSEIPILWMGGALAKTGTIDRLMSQSDLAATLLAQMHLDITPFIFSRNVLGTEYLGRKQFALHSVKNSLNYITPEGSAAYDCVVRKLLSNNAADQRFVEAVLQRLYKTTANLSRR